MANLLPTLFFKPDIERNTADLRDKNIITYQIQLIVYADDVIIIANGKYTNQSNRKTEQEGQRTGTRDN